MERASHQPLARGESIVALFARSEARLLESVPTLKPLHEKQQMLRAVLALAPSVGAMARPVKREPCRTAVVRVSMEETTDRKPRESPLEVPGQP